MTTIEAMPAFDLLVRGGDVVDGTGAPRIRADVGVRDGRIVAIGDLGAATARTTLDATGRVVTPGFIDAHVHSELAMLAQTPDASGGLLQGVTTNLTGPDGFGFGGVPAAVAREIEPVLRFAHGPMPDLSFDWPTPEFYLRAFEGRTPINIAAQAPHLPIRVGVMGWDARVATDAELDDMRAATAAWMRAGAVGLNSGLDYQPIAHSDTRELVALARVAAEHGGVYAAHGRNQDLGRAGQFWETAEVGRRAGLPVNVSHERVDEEMAAMLAETGAEPGLDLAMDTHLYEAGSTHLLNYVPFAQHAGGPMAVIERLGSAAYREQLRGQIEASLAASPEGLGAYFSATRTGRHVGRTIREIAVATARTPAETIVDLLRDELPDALMVFPWGPTEAEFRPLVAAGIAHPRVVISSDGLYWGGLPHPRGFGTFPRAIRVGVRELGAVTLEQAVNRMSGLPADRYRLADRGRVAVGFAADLVVFDPKTIADRATYAEPRLPPTGIDAVVVNGVIAAERGSPTGRLAGRVLRRATLSR